MHTNMRLLARSVLVLAILGSTFPGNSQNAALFRVLDARGNVQINNNPAIFNMSIFPNSSISVESDADLTVYSSDSKIRIVGPNNGTFEKLVGPVTQSSQEVQSIFGTMMTAFQHAAAFLPPRSGSIANGSPNVWRTYFGTMGEKCAPFDGRLTIALPEGAHNTYLSIRAVEMGVAKIIATKSLNELKWPDDIPLVDGTEYELELNAVSDPVRWRIFRISRRDLSTQQIAEFLVEHHCFEQLVALARSLPDDRVVGTGAH
jgi:hypothetical protein